jgi:putative copper export protein/methionine-rich copper-binding protein CopC
MKFAKLLLITAILSIPQVGNVYAHSSVSGTTPSDGSNISVSPEEFLITFNEKVTFTEKNFKMIDSEGNITTFSEVDSRDVENGTLARVKFENKLSGWNAIYWSATSADGHNIEGTVTFTVGNIIADGSEQSLVSKLNYDPLDKYRYLSLFLKYLNYVTTFLAVGLLGFIFILRRNSKKLKLDLDELLLEKSGKLITLVATLGAISAPLQIFLNTFILNSGEFEDFSIAFSISIGTPVGLSHLIRTSAYFAFCTAALLILDKKTKNLGKAILLLSAIALMYTFTISGHADLVDKESVAKVAILLHNIAGGLWLGSLAIVANSFRYIKNNNEIKIAVIAGFSKVATASLFILLPAGIALSWSMFNSFAEIFTTEYGQKLLLKIGFVTLLLLVGAYNHFLLVPKMIKDEDTTKIVRSMKIESFGLLGVLALTALLTNYGAPAAGGSHTSHLGVFSEEISSNPDIQDILPSISRAPYKEGEIEVRTDPSRAGVRNTIEVVVKDSDNYIVSNIKKISIEIEIPNLENGKITRELKQNKNKAWQLELDEFGFEGVWNVSFIINSGALSSEKVLVKIPIKPFKSELGNSNNE